jgi:hypothetical protein
MPISNCFNLFAYGTLMDRDELACNMVVPSSEVDRRLRIQVAELPGFRRIYNKPVAAHDGSVLNLAFDKESSVVGVLFMDMTVQEAGMLDSSYPEHLPRKIVDVMLEGDKVPATAYLAKEVDATSQISAGYEERVLELVRRLGGAILTNFLEQTAGPDGAPRYPEGKALAAAAPPAPEAGEAP